MTVAVNIPLKGAIMTRKLSDEQKIEIVEKYINEDCNCASLGKEYGVTRTSINRILRNRNIEIRNNRSDCRRKYSLNQDYFDIIDTEEKAYFLGLLYADGCNFEKGNSIQLALQEDDKEILDKFNTSLNSNRPLYLKPSPKKFPHRKKQYILSICNIKMSKRLAELGCFARKSLTLKFPTEDQVPSHLIRHFIRGYFDGDGSFTIGKTRQKSITLNVDIVSTFNFCSVIKQIWKDELNVNSNTYSRKVNTTTVTLQTGGVQQAYKILNWLYSNCSIYLERKYNKFKYIEQILFTNKLI